MVWAKGQLKKIAWKSVNRNLKIIVKVMYIQGQNTKKIFSSRQDEKKLGITQQIW
jgi:hypothetical protein